MRAHTRRVGRGQVGSVPGAGGFPGPGVQPGSCSPSPGNRGHSARPRSRKTLGDLGGRYALQVGVAPHTDPQKAPQGVRGKCVRFLPATGAFPFPGSWGWFFRERSKLPECSPNRARFLPKFTNVAGGFQLSHAMHWPDTFAQNSERTARRVPSVADVTDVGPIPGGRVPRTGFAILGMVDREPRGRLLELTDQLAGTP